MKRYALRTFVARPELRPAIERLERRGYLERSLALGRELFRA